MPQFARNVDPLGAFIARAGTMRAQRPVPLVATSFDVRIDGGLAIVATKRTYRNAEAASIEATLTFPVPVHATLFSLEANVNGRLLKAQAQRKSKARETYEDALERGKTAILHEELLRGVHMLSVGHIPPGAEIAVETVWAMPLTNDGGVGTLRIPLTVGDVYGDSGLPESDDLIHGGPVQSGDLSVTCVDGAVTLSGAALIEGRARIPLNAPIDLSVAGWTPKELMGRAADGREVALKIEPNIASDTALDAALIVDHSGSMAEAFSADTRQTKHHMVVAALRALAERMRGADTLDVWEFDNALRHVGYANARTRLSDVVARLSAPSGGTEIGAALAGVVSHGKSRDILIITDGKSHALDVQTLAQSGRRFSVVLIGEDSLEANVGYLASLTGGGIFIGAVEHLADTIVAALNSLRTPYEAPRRSGDRISIKRGEVVLSAEWRQAAPPSEETRETRAIAAVAASLLIPMLEEEAAAKLAEAEGLVTHLTSLVLVDEAETHEGIPAMRKVALPSPRMLQAASMSAIPPPPPAGAAAPGGVRARAAMSVESPRSARGIFGMLGVRNATAERRGGGEAARRAFALAIVRLAAIIDFDEEPNRLLQGDLSLLDADTAREIRALSQTQENIALAKKLGVDPVVLVLALIAQSAGPANRSASRLAKAVLKDPVA